MHDPSTPTLLDEWRDMAEEGALSARALPAAEVRARGDRARRRDVVARSALAAAVAVALITGVATVAGGGLGINVVPAGPRPTTIPTGLDIEKDPPTDPSVVEGPGEDLTVQRFAPCDGPQHGSFVTLPDGWVFVGPSTTAREVFGIHYVFPHADQARLVQLYPDADAAKDVMRELRDAVKTCPELHETVGKNKLVSTFTLADTGLGDDGVVITSRWSVNDGGSDVLPGVAIRHVIRIGAAILYVTELNESATTAEAEAELNARLTSVAEDLTKQLCDFSDERC